MFYTLDVGHGLCHIVLLPVEDRRAILIDGGRSAYPAEVFLREYVSVVEAAIVTHNDIDHVGALPSLLQRYVDDGTLKRLYILEDRELPKMEALVRFIADNEEKLRGRLHFLYVEDAPGTRLFPRKGSVRCGVTATLLYPDPLDNVLLRAGKARKGRKKRKIARKRRRTIPNATSACLRIETPDVAFLVTGDLELPGFEQMVDAGRDLSADVLCVPHHGGSLGPGTPASWDDPWRNVIAKVSPQIAVVSCGTNGKTRPRSEVIGPLRDSGCTIACTELVPECAADPQALYPGLTRSDLQYPQRSGVQDYPEAVACFGTVAISIRDGTPVVERLDEHARAIAEAGTAVAPLCT